MILSKRSFSHWANWNIKKLNLWGIIWSFAYATDRVSNLNLIWGWIGLVSLYSEFFKMDGEIHHSSVPSKMIQMKHAQKRFQLGVKGVLLDDYALVVMYSRCGICTFYILHVWYTSIYINIHILFMYYTDCRYGYISACFLTCAHTSTHTHAKLSHPRNMTACSTLLYLQLLAGETFSWRHHLIGWNFPEVFQPQRLWKEMVWWSLMREPFSRCGIDSWVWLSWAMNLERNNVSMPRFAKHEQLLAKVSAELVAQKLGSI